MLGKLLDNDGLPIKLEIDFILFRSPSQEGGIIMKSQESSQNRDVMI